MVEILHWNHNGDYCKTKFEHGIFATFEKEHDNDLIVRDKEQRILASFERGSVAHVFSPNDQGSLS